MLRGEKMGGGREKGGNEEGEERGIIHSLPTDCSQYNKNRGRYLNDVNVSTTNKRRVLPGLKTGLLSLMSVR